MIDRTDGDGPFMSRVAQPDAWRDALPKMMETGEQVIVHASVLAAYPAGRDPDVLDMPWPYSEMDELPELSFTKLYPNVYAARIDFSNSNKFT